MIMYLRVLLKEGGGYGKKNAKMNGENEKNCLKVIRGARVSKVVKGF